MCWPPYTYRDRTHTYSQVKDAPGEAGTRLSSVQPVSSQQTLLMRSELVEETTEMAEWNQPQMVRPLCVGYHRVYL